MFDASLATVLRTLSPAEKFDLLARLHPSDARALLSILEDCITHRWPKTSQEWFAVAERVTPKH